MERFKSLNRYQKSLIIVMIAMTLFFLVLYINRITKVGFDYYGNKIFEVSQENGNTVYSGKIAKEDVRFIVHGNESVVLHYGDKTYGPYTVKEDPTIVLQVEEYYKEPKGIEVYCGDKIIFRGEVWESVDPAWLFRDEDGEGYYYASYKPEKDAKGVVRLLPSAMTIYTLLNNPELTHKGEILLWLAGAFICSLNVLSILFTNELFQWDLMFRLRDSEYAEPSGFELAKRYISWTVITIIALGVFATGLVI